MSEWKEDLHPRGKGGKFGSGGWVSNLSDRIGQDIGGGKTEKGRIKDAGVRAIRYRNSGAVVSLISRPTKADRTRIHSAIITQSKKPINIRASETAINSILDNKRMKNIHELPVSAKGKDYLGTRTAYENEVMGLHGVESRKRPVYGYVGNVNEVTSYGAYAITLKDSVRKRTTVSAGDSLNGATDVRPIDSLHTLDFNQVRGIINADNALPLKFDGEIHKNSYMEAQIHGGVRIGDIASITVPADASPALIKRIEAHGIKVHIEVDQALEDARKKLKALGAI